MKLVVDSNKVILYLNRMYIQALDFKDKEETEKYMKFLLTKLASKYDMNFSGYEMNTKIIHGSFLYEVRNLDEEVFNKFYVYKIKEKLYLRIKKELSDFEMGRVLENATIIYGKKADKIIRKAHLVR